MENHSRIAKQELLLEEGVEALERELAEKYYLLGREVYETADRKIGEINGLVDRLVEEKVKLTQLRGQTACPGCLALNPNENHYCGRCGGSMRADRPGERRADDE